MKKSHFRILTYLCVSRSPEIIYAIFTVMYVHVCVRIFVCKCARVYVSEDDTVLMLHLVELKFFIYDIGHRRAIPIDFDECRINRFFLQEYKMNIITAYLAKLLKISNV